MKSYYKLQEILVKLKQYGLATLKNDFLLEKNLEDENYRFNGRFLIVSETESSEKYFLTLNVSSDTFEDNDDFPEIWRRGCGYWEFIPLIYFLTTNAKRICVWSEGRVTCEGCRLTFFDGPGEIDLAGVKQTIEIIERIDPQCEVFYTFDDMHCLYLEPNIYKYNLQTLLKRHNIIK